jgi:hypothetical protein
MKKNFFIYLFAALVNMINANYSNASPAENNVDHKNKNDNSAYSGTEVVTPEKFGAIGDGGVHKLSTVYKSLSEAQKVYPGVTDLDVTLDGAALQKAVDYVSEKGGGEVDAEKKYTINYPIITRDNVTIDGKTTGSIYNDRSRSKYVLRWAFFLGDHHATAFNPEGSKDGSYQLYDVDGSITSGQDYVQLAKASDASSFKVGQLIMVISSSKRQQNGATFLPFHITICKIKQIAGIKLSFEYPIDEDVSSAQVAANGSIDQVMGINFAGVQNVTIKNLTIDADQITGRTYGYNCHLDHIQLNNGVTHLIGCNALCHSSITNISGTFSWRCIEIKTGTSDLLVKNIKASYKPVSDTSECRGIISTGEYNRNITIDSFSIDCGNAKIMQPLITIQARKATISNGVIYCKSQQNSFVKFFNERYVPDPKLGCYGNKIINVKFYGSENMKNVLALGDNPNKQGGNNNTQPGKQRTFNAKANGGADDEREQGPYDVPPTSNLIENCVFDGGSPSSFASINGGSDNVIRNCTFTKAKIKNREGANNSLIDNKEASGNN